MLLHSNYLINMFTMPVRIYLNRILFQIFASIEVVRTEQINISAAARSDPLPTKTCVFNFGLHIPQQ